MRRFLLLCPLLVVGCQSRDVDILAKIGQRAGQKLEDGFGISPEVMAGRMRGPLEDTGLAGRVRVRLLFDRYVGEAQVQISVPSNGVVRLRATVADGATRQRILDLTTLLRLQRTELNYMRCELRALASLLGVQREESMSRHPSSSGGKHLHSV